MTTVIIDDISATLEKLTPQERKEIADGLRAYMSTIETTKRIVVSLLFHPDRDIARKEPWQVES
jgi:hypothetical protein